MINDYSLEIFKCREDLRKIIDQNNKTNVKYIVFLVLFFVFLIFLGVIHG